jgi:hypothetical protein
MKSMNRLNQSFEYAFEVRNELVEFIVANIFFDEGRRKLIVKFVTFCMGTSWNRCSVTCIAKATNRMKSGPVRAHKSSRGISEGCSLYDISRTVS